MCGSQTTIMKEQGGILQLLKAIKRTKVAIVHSFLKLGTWDFAWRKFGPNATSEIFWHLLTAVNSCQKY